MPTFIHPTAIVDPAAEIGEDVAVGPYCVIDGHVKLGGGCRLYHGAYVTGWTEVGEGCVLHPHVIVGHEPQDVKYHGERSYCRVGPRTVLRENVTIHRGTDPESTTTVGEDCFLLGGSHVAHNCTLGNHVTLINNVLLAGHVRIADRATLGGGAVVHQFVRIGELAMIAGNARVPMDVVPFALIDAEGRIAGVNRLGVRRAEYGPQEIEGLRHAYRTLFERRGVSFNEAVQNLEQSATTTAAKKVLAFVAEKSRRGLAGMSRER